MANTKEPQRSTKLSLDRNRAESDALFLSIGEGAIATDEHGRISRVNQAALDIWGYKASELIGKWYPKTIIAEDEEGNPIPAVERPITQALLSGKPVSRRLYYRRKDKRRIVAYITVSAVMLDNEPIGAIQVFRDITKEVELEQAKDEFISLASHQLRTPATAVKQYAGMLLQGYAGDLTATQRMMAENIYESNERQLAIVNDLLRVAQVDAGKVKLHITKTNLVQLIEDVIEELYAKFSSKKQRVSFTKPAHFEQPEVDSKLIRMVIENVLDNASKYTPADKDIAIRLGSNQHFALIDIEDSGVGIKKDDLPLLFQKFSRLPNRLSDEAGGTGLGLYWAKKIIDLHGGSITVHSKPNKGTTFTIRVPHVPVAKTL